MGEGLRVSSYNRIQKMAHMKSPLLALLLSISTSLHASPMDTIAERYVKLVLAVGQYDPDYVDAYYGPEEWRVAAGRGKEPLDSIAVEARSLIARLDAIDPTGLTDEMLKLRRDYLKGQLSALVARVEMLGGKKFSFDEESRLLYDAVAPTYDAEHFKAILKEIDALLPGEGTIRERYENFRKRFIIPAAKLDTVFRTAIEECRRRTRGHIALPQGESFTVEYVANKPWGGYNWYKGNSRSIIQVNTDLPSYIDRAIDLAAHEGYPGHHVYNALLEEQMVKKRGWIEFTVYPLFSPQSLIAEGSANYGVHVVMTDEERLKFERTVLFPLAGLDPTLTETYEKVMDLIGKLSYAGNEAARGYLDGTMTRDQAALFLEEYELMTPERAQKRLDFIQQYRGYVINYNLGQDMVKQYVELRAHTPQQQWEEFGRLLSSPRLPSGLAETK